MKTLFIGKNCIEVEKTDSTNTFLAGFIHFRESSGSSASKQKGSIPVYEGTTIIARNQERGRGQRGASWESEPGKNLTLSILLQPSFLTLEQQFQLNKTVSLGVAEFVEGCISTLSGGVGEKDVKIKWPNDIYIGTKKVAGILIESSVNGNKLGNSIIGIGLNVNQDQFSAHLPNPTSLKLITRKEFDLKECLEQLCSCIEKRYLELRSGHTSGIDSDYLNKLYRFNEFSSYKYKGEELMAKITGLAKVGKLMIETEKGKMLECDFKELVFG